MLFINRSRSYLSSPILWTEMGLFFSDLKGKSEGKLMGDLNKQADGRSESDYQGSRDIEFPPSL